MTTVTQLKDKIATRTDKVITIEEYLAERKSEVNQLLPQNMSIDRFLRVIYSALRHNPKLADCTPQSICAAVFQAAQLSLEPNTEGQCYLIPYKNTKIQNGKKTYVDECQFQIGYKGYIELFYRHGAALSIDMHSVYENDLFEYGYGTNSYLKHCPALKDRGEVIAYYAIAMLKNGGSLFKVMSKTECLEHGKRHSKCFITKKWDDAARTYIPCEPHFDKNSPWATEFDAMCKKTVLIQLAKLLPKSVALQKALAMDCTTKSEIKADMFDVKDETEWGEYPEYNNDLLPQITAGG
ncbi:recombinase RecT [bacterium]|nr:recombinase RecT [bacterium]